MILATGAWAKILINTNHIVRRKHQASGASHCYVELGGSHLDCGSGEESRKLENGGKVHVVETEGKGREKS